MNITTEVIETENLDEIFDTPKNYVDVSYDRPLVKIWQDGKELFTILIGVDDIGNFYLVAEDDEVSEDYYPNKNEPLWSVYYRILNEWVN